MIQFLAELEETNFKNEMKKRDRDEKLFIPEDTPENRYKKFDIIPTKERAIEKYINPFKSGWEYRYYKSLFNIDINDDRRKQICLNYLEGLEWNMKYYTSGCVDWRWCYKYNYPPLLVDLIKYIPYFETSFFSNDTKLNKPVSQLVQLCYVLPRPSLKLLPNNLYTQIMKKYNYLYPSDAEFTWAYCKYFWESHVNLPEIDLNEMEEFVNSNTFFKK